MKKTFTFILISICFISLQVQDLKGSVDNNRLRSKDSVALWSVHFQFTNVIQSHPSFKSVYSGKNSFKNSAEKGVLSISSGLFIGRKLWKGAALLFNPEITGGSGLSNARGIAASPNGEVFRIENPDPKFYVGRIYMQQIFPLKNTGYENLPSEANQLAGKTPSSRFVINFGKINMADFFDDNRYAHDPRTQFFNWVLMDQGAWDYPASTRGYTQGLVLELIKPKWELRAATALLPDLANGPKLNYHWTKSNSTNLEYTRKWSINKHAGTVRGLLYYQTSKMPSYRKATQLLLQGDSSALNIIRGVVKAPASYYGGNKYGFGISADQELSNDLGVFARLGWNDGKHATWIFTEVDHSATLGASLSGKKWNRPNDIFGLATALGGISKDHRNYLKAGGYGFMLGDGRLNYGPELLLESYYLAQIHPSVSISLDYQFINHPGYNKDRGPVHVFGVRGHVAF